MTDPEVVILWVVDRGEPGLRRVELSIDGELLGAWTLTLAQVRRLLLAVPRARVRAGKGEVTG